VICAGPSPLEAPPPPVRGAGSIRNQLPRGTIHMWKDLIKLLRDEEGATALEYGLMAAAVAGVLIVVAYFLGNRVGNSINNVAIHI
jgi:pilus assembly protein Flp/PilA